MIHRGLTHLPHEAANSKVKSRIHPLAQGDAFGE